MFSDRASYLDDRGLLKGVGAYHSTWDLAGYGDDGDAVEKGVGEATNQVSGPGAGGGDADAGLAGGAGVALRREDAALLVAWEDVADEVGACEGLVDLH